MLCPVWPFPKPSAPPKNISENSLWASWQKYQRKKEVIDSYTELEEPMRIAAKNKALDRFSRELEGFADA